MITEASPVRPNAASQKERRLSRAAAAEYVREEHGLPCTKGTLQKLATVGGGPEYQKWGNRAVYLPSKLDDWVARKLGRPKASTSDAGDI